MSDSSSFSKRSGKPAAAKSPRQNASAPRPAARRPSTSSSPGLTALKGFLSTLDIGVKPTVHVNGAVYTTAFLTVDLGVPLNAVRLLPEQENDLSDHIRAATRDLLRGREMRISVFRDQTNGIWWSAMS